MISIKLLFQSKFPARTRKIIQLNRLKWVKKKSVFSKLGKIKNWMTFGFLNLLKKFEINYPLKILTANSNTTIFCLHCKSII